MCVLRFCSNKTAIFLFMENSDFLRLLDNSGFIENALLEDLGEGDHTTLATLSPDLQGNCRALVKGSGIIAGITFAKEVFRKMDASVQFVQHFEDGVAVKPGDILFTAQGKVSVLLLAERLVLNVMQRMSGIATTTRRACDLISDFNCSVLDTRKTVPLNRILDKWAVKLGGGVNHRFGLYDMILVKDNHIDWAGGIKPALESVQKYLTVNKRALPVEVEARTLAEIKQILEFDFVDRILLDNMEVNEMKTAVQMIAGKTETEASGNITLENIKDKASSGVNYVSLGWLTHSVQSLDISLKAEKS